MPSNIPPVDVDINFRQGDIVWAQYPLTDKIDKLKKRPVLIISNEGSNELDLDYIVVPMTKTVRSEPFSLLIQPEDVLGDLPVVSELRCNKPFTVRQQLLYDKIGTLNYQRTQQVIQLVADAIQVMEPTNL